MRIVAWQRLFFQKLVHNEGQSTVEAAFMIPVIFIMILLLIQPAIILYDLTVMNEASAETCRVLSTCGNDSKNNICDAFVRRRLSAIPQQENFHVHSGGCSYSIDLNGDESSSFVSVKISNKVKPLPILSALVSVLGACDENGNIEIKSYSEIETRPEWVSNSLNPNNPEKWPGEWLK